MICHFHLQSWSILEIQDLCSRDRLRWEGGNSTSRFGFREIFEITKANNNSPKIRINTAGGTVLLEMKDLTSHTTAMIAVIDRSFLNFLNIFICFRLVN